MEENYTCIGFSVNGSSAGFGWSGRARASRGWPRTDHPPTDERLGALVPLIPAPYLMARSFPSPPDGTPRTAPGHPRLRLHHHARARRRWHVARLRGARGIAAAKRRGEGAATRAAGRRERRALRPRDRARGRTPAPAHRAGTHRRTDERRAVLHDAVRGRGIAPGTPDDGRRPADDRGDR